MKFVELELGPVRLKLLGDDKVAAIIENEGAFEPQSLEVWREVCAGGKASTVIDVGAYSGIFAISAALMGNIAIAIEPKKSLATRTISNAFQNRATVEVIEAAASNFDGEGELHMNGAHFSVASSLLHDATRHNRTQKVRVVSLDAIGLPHPRVGAIKIDVEGSESDVIAGALRLIERDRPVLIVETMPDPDRQERVKALLPGYRALAFIDGRNLHMVPA